MANKKVTKANQIEAFNLPVGKILARKYVVIALLGSGWEGEVYEIRELNTGIRRAAKLFFPQRNIGNKTSNLYARKLHKLRHCPILIQHHAEETIIFKGIPITVLISEFVKGEILSTYLKRQPGGRIMPFQAVHLLHSLTSGIATIHKLNEYHGDLHADNIMVSRAGLNYHLKLLDMFHWDFPKRENIQDDICDLIKIFYDALGGAKHYAKQPKEVKNICLGLKRSLILKKFRTAKHLKEYLEEMEWS
jgi:serine/threonine protein kinase